jgi:uncharacterized protein (TIGR02145 family)
MKRKTIFMTISFMMIVVYTSAQVTGTYTDPRDGRQYKTVNIGTQTWMAENLAFKSDAGCYVYENSEKYLTGNGYLYTWETARKVCPSGWHLSSQKDWITLSTFLGGETIAADKLKEPGTVHWQNPVSQSTNESGFTAIPGGYRNENGDFYVLGYNGWWWCSDEKDTEKAYHVLIYGHTKDVAISYIKKSNGFSVRCVKD